MKLGLRSHTGAEGEIFFFFDNRGFGYEGTIALDRIQAVVADVVVKELGGFVPFIGLAD